MEITACDLVLPCRDEGPALPALLAEVPPGFSVIVVDNGSRDDTADGRARAHGARVVREQRPGTARPCTPGLEAATAELRRRDGRRRLVRPGRAPALLARGRRRDGRPGGRAPAPVGRGVWPWHARGGNAWSSWWLRRRSGLPVHDIAPMRVCRRAGLLALDVRDRRFGYPVELLRKAARAGWRLAERDVAYHPRAAGTRSKVSGSVRGTLRAAPRLREGAA